MLIRIRAKTNYGEVLIFPRPWTVTFLHFGGALRNKKNGTRRRKHGPQWRFCCEPQNGEEQTPRLPFKNQARPSFIREGQPGQCEGTKEDGDYVPLECKVRCVHLG